ncbi:CLUMA_CG014493, isoform A [Clunio marinus]|uniref:CLUMA_CG014493, isoform A n=1 Tax=Clunio marinus TaxID=568069 RepID=A0A1J1IMP3_9DIPT|nr:CLUMA_CG014493, isoform A [Clunio marinus]
MDVEQKFEDDTGELEITEDYVVLDDATTGTGTSLDLSNLRKRKTKIISSAKETIENGRLSPIFIKTEIMRVKCVKSIADHKKLSLA